MLVPSSILEPGRGRTGPLLPACCQHSLVRGREGMGVRRGMQDRYGLVGAVWGVRGELSRTWAQRGHCWLHTGPVAALHSVGPCCWQNLCMGTL